MDRNEKEQAIGDLKKIFEESSLVLVLQQRGLTVTESTDLRSKMREQSSFFKVAKNRLAKIALKGTPCEQMIDLFSGPTAIAYSEDPVMPAKVAAEFAKTNNKLEICGGIMDGKLLDAQAVNALSKMPSLDELRGKIISVIQAPATRIACVLDAPVIGLARVFRAYGSSESA